MSQARGRLSPNHRPSRDRRLILIVAMFAFALAASAPAAHAKGISQATVCGADGCIDITSRLHDPGDCTDCSAEQLMSAMPGSAHPSRQAPYVRIVLGFGHPDQGGVEARERILYSSELRLGARQEGPDEWAWFRLPPAALAAAVRLTRDITPYPATSMRLGRPKLTGTLVPAPAERADRPPPPPPTMRACSRCWRAA